MKKEVLLSILLLLPMLVRAYVGYVKINGLYYYVNTPEGYATVENHRGNSELSGSIVIPSTIVYDGVTCTVTSIGSEAFAHCYKITSVTIPNTVTTIHDNAFNSCQSLTSIVIPNSVTSIKRSAFNNCNLKLVKIPNSVKELESWCFSNNKNLRSASIPASLKKTGHEIFKNTALKTVTIRNVNGTTKQSRDKKWFQSDDASSFAPVSSSPNYSSSSSSSSGWEEAQEILAIEEGRKSYPAIKNYWCPIKN